MKTYEFDGVTICVKRKYEALVSEYPDITKVVEDYEGDSGLKLLLLEGKGISEKPKEPFLSENVDTWWVK